MKEKQQRRVRIRLYHKEAIFLTPEHWVTNKRWACKADLIRVSQKNIQSLIEAGIAFSRREGEELITGPEATPPSMSSVLRDDLIPDDEKRAFTKTPFIYSPGTTSSSIRLYRDFENRIIGIQENYVPLMDLGSPFQEEVDRGIYVFREGEIVAVVMPIAGFYYQDEFKKLAQKIATA